MSEIYVPKPEEVALRLGIEDAHELVLPIYDTFRRGYDSLRIKEILSPRSQAAQAVSELIHMNDLKGFASIQIAEIARLGKGYVASHEGVVMEYSFPDFWNARYNYDGSNLYLHIGRTLETPDSKTEAVTEFRFPLELNLGMRRMEDPEEVQAGMERIRHDPRANFRVETAKRITPLEGEGWEIHMVLEISNKTSRNTTIKGSKAYRRFFLKLDTPENKFEIGEIKSQESFEVEMFAKE